LSFWSFEEKHPKSIHRDPFEAEFFTGEDDDDQEDSRTDSLIREVLPNSLDASREDGPVRVRIAIDRHVQLLSPQRASHYLSGLIPHLEAMGNTLVDHGTTLPEMDYLVIEDFGTHVSAASNHAKQHSIHKLNLERFAELSKMPFGLEWWDRVFTISTTCCSAGKRLQWRSHA
jgi:hypothetical protein